MWVILLKSIVRADGSKVTTRLRNRRVGIAAGRHVRLSNDTIGFRQLSDTGRTEFEEKDVHQERTVRYVFYVDLLRHGFMIFFLFKSQTALAIIWLGSKIQLETSNNVIMFQFVHLIVLMR